MAVRYAFEALTGIPTEVVPAIELSRYYSESQLGFAPHNPLVILLSLQNIDSPVRAAGAGGQKFMRID